MRERTPFDASWRFVLGDAGYAPACDTSAFTANLSGTRCLGGQMIFVSSAELCEAACCGNPQCTNWQWCEQPCVPRSPGWGCYNGVSCAVNTTVGVQNWVGAARALPAPAPPPPALCANPALPCAQAFNDSAWRTVSTPHDFVNEQAYSQNADEEHGFLPFNVSWYRRSFAVNATPGAILYIDFDGVYKNSDVWLNGVYLGRHTSGYTAFRYFLHNVTSAAADGSRVPVLRLGGGENVLAVRADALSVQEGWFYEGGGIYRHVWLTVTDALSIVPWGVYLPSAVTGAIASGPLGAMGPQSADAVIMSQTDVANARAEAALFTLTTAAFDASGAQVAQANSTQTLAPGGTVRLFLDLPVQNASLWNTESPVLYTVRSTLWVSGNAVDEVSTRIGIRSAVWSPTQGFQLNGYKVPVQGFSNHQSFAGCGNAVPSRVDAFRVAKLRSLGANMWRGSYPTSSELLMHADRLGMMMWEENRFLQYVVQPVQGRQRGTDPPLPPDVAIADPQLLRDAQDMVLRDRNHPSVVIWSLCNEGGCDIGAPSGGVIAAQFKAAITAADTTRPITANTEWAVGSSDTLTNILDVMTVSYNYASYEIYHRHHPSRPFMGPPA